MKSRIILCITICLFQGLHAAVSQTIDLGLARKYVVLANSGVSGVPQDGIGQKSDIDSSERAAAGLISSFRIDDVSMGNSVNNLEWQGDADLNGSAVDDMLDAYANALLLPPSHIDFNNGKIGGAILSPGVYKWNSDVLIDADIVFSGGQDDVWVFQIDGNLEQTDGVDMDLSGCGQENNVFWIVSGTSSIGQKANFEGNLLGDKDITLQNEAVVNGRVFSRNVVNLNDNIFRYAESGILEISKVADQQTYYYVGQVIMYTIVVNNAGTEPIYYIDVDDPRIDFHANIHLLNPCNPYTYHVFYTITQSDIDNGSIVNTVCAASFDGEHDECATETIYAIKDARISLTKSGDKESFVVPGETIIYQIVVNNPGNVTLKDVLISDDITNDVWYISILSPGVTETFSTSYVTTQSDVDAGQVINTASVIAVDPQGETVEDEDQAIVMVAQLAQLTIDKTTEALAYDHAGEEITYQINLSNTGNVTLRDIAVTDDLTGEIWTIALLVPGESVLYSTTYIVLQADVDTGQLSNLAVASGRSPGGEPVEDSDQVDLKAIQTPDLTLVKNTESTSYDQAGDEITYQITLTNTGNVSLSDIAVTDDLTGESWAIAMLAPGESVQYSTPYIVLQADVDAGRLLNLAVASGIAPGGELVEDSDQVDLEATQIPDLRLVKTTEALSYDHAGEEIFYQLTVLNAGNVTLSDIVVTDDLTGESWTIALLVPGESVLYSTTYIVLQADVDAGQLLNLAVTSGSAPGGEPVEDIDQVELEAIQTPDLTLVKTTTAVSYDHVGEEITYQITVENTGNVTLTDIVVTDDLTGENWTIALLSPGESVLFSTTYIVLQADLDAGQLSNLATASGIAPDGEPVEDSDGVELEAIQTPGLTLVKTTDAVTYNQAGEEITYQITVSNTGNVTLSDISVTDDLTGERWTIVMLAPGENVLYSTTYIVLQADVDAGQLSNLASASGRTPGGEPIEDSDQVNLEAIQTPGILVVKTANPTSYENEGDIIQFAIEVSNTGNVTLTGISLTDFLTEETWAAAKLAPGEKLQYTTPYSIKLADIFAGSVTNRARVEAMAPSGVTVDDEDTATVHVTMKPAMQLTKTASQTTFNAVGDVITYAIDLLNTGNVILRNISVNDNLTNETWAIESINPGEGAITNATYVITQADMDFGSVENIATATATDPAGNTLHASDSERIFTAQISGISIEKNATPLTYDTVGARIDYTIDITNLGNVTLVNVQISDNLTGESWLIDVLLPGEKHTVNTSYTISQADLDHGSVVNVASVSGTDPHGQPVFDSDDEVVTAIINPSLAITKNASPSQYSDVGDVINFTFIVTNNGNVTITDVQVDDIILDARWNIPTLAPGESRTFNASYTITQMEVDDGEFPNTVTVNGKDPLGNDVTASDSETVTIDRQLPSMTITKTADPPVFISDGELITYTIVVENTGNVTLYNLTIADDLTREGWSLAVLPRGGSEQYTTTYRITAADLSRGEVINIVTAFGYDPKGFMVDATAEETIITIRVPGGLTPDTDFDDTWFIRGLDYFPQNTVQIFNRWGTLVYEASPYLNDWDGVPNRGLIATDADGKVPAGTYYYVLVLKPGFKPMSGYIYLIKN